MNEELKADVYDYLNTLRESGITNMFGAAVYLQDEFGFVRKEAKEWLLS